MPGADDPPPGRGGPQPDAPPASSGERRSVAGYRLLRRVGEGGMSTVYLSYDVPGRRAVAVKLLADHLAGQREFVNRFYREAKLGQRLRHPNVVEGYAAGLDPEAHAHYLVMEYIDGPSAHAALTQTGRLPVATAVAIGADIARALQYLHDRNYVHRDVKPDNVLLHPDGAAKLADLGLAKRLDDDAHLTSVNQGVGTSYYMPFEQAMNSGLVDGRSDVFALGATLYHLLTGEVPFRGGTHDEIIREKERNACVPVRDLNPDVPAELAAIIARTLACDPRSRYQRAADLAAALEATGLAARVPGWSASGPPDRPTIIDATPIDTPTRADLPLSPRAAADAPPARPGVPCRVTPNRADTAPGARATRTLFIS